MNKLLLALLISASCCAVAEETTGQQYRAWPEIKRLMYVVGYLDGYYHGFFFEQGIYSRKHERTANISDIDTSKPVDQYEAEQTTKKALAKEIQDIHDHPGKTLGAGCLAVGGAYDVTQGQVMAILDKYIDDHPERWDKPVRELAQEAFIDACEKRAKKP
jgi:hypothetical protein